jgi:hypothetical protein
VRNTREFAEDCQAAYGLSQEDLVMRYALALRALRVTWASRRAAQERIEQLRSGGKFLGKAIAELNDIALDATGLHDAINENGDGDWQAVWENVSDLGERLRSAQRRIGDLQAMNSGAEHRIDELESDLVRIAKLEAERDSARAQFGLLFDFLAERGASFSTERGKVVAVSLPESQVQR